MDQETPLWLIVTGPPAAGKTTLVRRLAQDLNIPLFEKDTVKDLLYKTLGFGDKPWSRQIAPTITSCHRKSCWESSHPGHGSRWTSPPK